MNRLKELEGKVSASLKRAESEAFEPGSLRGVMRELREQRQGYQELLEERVDLGGGRMIQRQDYLALQSCVAGCQSTLHSPKDLWAKLLGMKLLDDPCIELDEQQRVSLLRLDEFGLTAATIPPTLTRMRSLMLSKNQLRRLEIPGTLTSLEGLSVDDNKLTQLSIPTTLTRLESLGVSSNQLTQIIIPAKLTSLKALNLARNRLTQLEIPDSLTQLRRLGVSENRLTHLEIPDTLTNLTYLWCHNNNTTLVTLTIPERFTQLQVSLTGCRRLSKAVRSDATRRGWKLA